MKVFKLLIFTFSFFLFTFAVGKADAAVKTWNPAACGSTSWNTAGNWSGGLPGTADIATFDGATSNCNVTVDTSVDVAGINITGSYTGTITQGNGNDITIRGSGYTQNASGSTFTGGDATSDITFTSAGGDFSLTTGAFTAPAGTITVGDNWTISGGTFTATSGNIVFDLESDTALTIAGTATMNNVTFLHDNCSGEATLSVASGTTLTVNGTFTIDQETCSIFILNGPGSISAKGDLEAISNSQDRIYGTLVITVNGTTDQDMSGSGTYNPVFPSIVINKSSGNLNLSGTIYIADDFTYTAGTVVPGTSTLIFQATTDLSSTITGSLTLWNVTFANYYCAGEATITVASGTVITVNGTLTNTQGPCSHFNINGPGTISAKGDLQTSSTSNDKLRGNLVISINGNGSQTVTGSGTTDPYFTSLTIDKPGGTLHLIGTFGVANDFTYLQGHVDPGTSEVIFNPTTDLASTITGSVSLANVTFLQNVCGGSVTITIASGTVLKATGNLTIDEASCSNLDIDGPGTVHVEGDFTTVDTGETIGGDVAITFTGSKDQTFTQANSNFPTGTVTVNKSAGTVTFGSDIVIPGAGQDFVVSSGVVNAGSYSLIVLDTINISGQLNGYGATGGVAGVGVITVGSKGVWTQVSGGDVGLLGGVVNDGFIRFQGGGSICGGGNDISITSMGSPTTVPWSGSGTFILNDVSVQDQTGSITAYSSTNVSGNNWTFVSDCPAYSNRSVSNVTGGSSFTGGATFRSN